MSEQFEQKPDDSRLLAATSATSVDTRRGRCCAMSSDSAIERLRALLNERGVKHVGNGGMTRFIGKDGCVCRAYTRPGHLTVDVAIMDASPEQAVAATVGPGTCHAANASEYAWDDFECSECGWVTWGFIMEHEGCGTVAQPKFCPNCGRKVVDE